MIITRTPLSIKILGFFTDHKNWYEENSGSTIGLCLNKYVYVLGRFFNNYEKKQEDNCEYIKAVKAYLKIIKISSEDINIEYFCDLPNNSGLCFKQSLIIGILKTILCLKKIYFSNKQLSLTCNDIIINYLKEECFISDSFFCTNGGLNYSKIDKFGNVLLAAIKVNKDQIQALINRIGLFYLGDFQIKHEIPNKQKNKEIWSIFKHCDDGISNLCNQIDIKSLINNISYSAKIKNTSFILQKDSIHDEFANKCTFSKVSTYDIDSDGKFGLIYNSDEIKSNNLNLLNCFNKIDFSLDFFGSSIILCE